MEDFDEYLYDDDGNPMRCPEFEQEENPFEGVEDNKDIFHVKGDGYDVTLSLASGLITWKNVNPTGKKKGIFKGKHKGTDDMLTVMLRDVFGVKMKRVKSSAHEEGEGRCIGFSLHVAEIAGPNSYNEKVILFEHPSEAMCTMYVRKIQDYISEIRGRPKSIKMYLQGHAGTKHGASVYKSRVFPLFDSAGVSVDCVEVQHNEHIKQDMVHINLSDYDCIVAMGGDGTANKVIDGLLTHSQKDYDIEPKPGFTPVRAKLPVGIIPTGTTNHIVRSAMGTDDIASAVIHIILGKFTPVDITSVYREDKFMQWCFNSQYGFAGNVLTFRKRYRSLGKRGLEPAFVKALTKSKLRSYKCDIEYIPASPQPNRKKFVPCWRGCDVCWNERISRDDEIHTDLVMPFNPLEESGDSEALVDLAEHEDNPWKSIKGDFINVSLFTIPGRSEIAPRGLSKFTHLNDGVMDLVLVKNTERKEFIRLLKRLGNTKNQYDFPFVQVLRVKEVRFRLRFPTGFNYNDYNFSEIDYEIQRKQKQVSALTKSTEILEIDDIDEINSDSESDRSTPVNRPNSSSVVQSNKKNRPPLLKAKSFQVESKKKELKRTSTETSIDLPSSDSDSDDDSEEENGKDDDDDWAGEVVSVNANGVRHVRRSDAAPQKLVGPAYRPTYAEKDREKRNKRARKKEEKKKAKEQEKMKSIWNLDNETCTDDNLDFRVHHGLLRVCGQGVSADTVLPDTTLLCVPRL